MGVVAAMDTNQRTAILDDPDSGLREPSAVGGPDLPDRFSPRFAKGFAWYVPRLLRRHFHAVRLLSGDARHFEAARDHGGPVLIAMTHPGWWDPIVAFWLWSRWLGDRSPIAPMEAEQLRRFGFFRRLGIFGIDPDAPDALRRTAGHIARRFAEDRRRVLWITPQGRFTDARDDAPLRPGAAAIAASTEGALVIALAVEYAFWQDQRPEVFLAAAQVEPPEGAGFRRTTPGWHRALTAALRGVRARLAESVVARNPDAFEALLGGDAARINPLYDLWLRLRGRGGAIAARRRP